MRVAYLKSLRVFVAHIVHFVVIAALELLIHEQLKEFEELLTNISLCFFLLDPKMKFTFGFLRVDILIAIFSLVVLF
jgi:hypothetical protein